MQETYEQLKEAVDAIGEDITKAEAGNAAAGTRVRKAMQVVKGHAQDLRKQALEARK